MAGDRTILLCTDHLPPSDGGVEQVVEQLARRLSDRGYRIVVFTLRAPDEQIDLADHPRVTVVGARKVDLTKYLGLQTSVSPRALSAFKRVLDRHDPDIVHVHNRFFFTSYLGLLYKPFYDYRLVTTLHLGDIDSVGGVGGVAAVGFQSTAARTLVRRSDAVIAVSDAVGAVAHELGANRVSVVPNSVDLERFSRGGSPTEKTVLYVGRLIRNNGPQDLVEALPEIVDRHPAVEVNFVGGGPLQERLQERITELGLEESVTVHGFVDDITSMYERAEIFCRPSYSEGLPLTLLESMATRTVPVVTPVAGSREIVTDAETGCFVDVGDPSSIAERVGELLDRPLEREHIADAARAYVEENLSWEQRASEIVAVYDEVLREHVEPGEDAPRKANKRGTRTPTHDDD